MNAATLKVEIGASLTGLQRGLAQARASIEGFSDRISNLGGQMTAAVTLPIAALGAAAITTAARFDGLKRALEAQAGSAEGAAAQFERLREVAKLPGLGLEEAIQGSVRLQAVGFSAEMAERTLRGVGNALAQAGAGKAELDGVMLALQQIASKGKVSAEEINQIAERMPQIRAAMQGAFGTADTEALQRMGISSEQFVDGILTQLEKLPVAAGGIGVALENAGDAAKLALMEIGNAISTAIDLPALAERFAAFTERAVTAFKRFNEAHPLLTRVGVVLAGVAAAAGPVMVVLGGVAAAIGALGAPVALAVAGLGALVAAAAGMAAAWSGVTDTTSGLGRVMQQAGTAFNTLKAIGMEAYRALAKGVTDAVAQMRPAIESLSAFWERNGDTIMFVVRQVVRVVTTTLGGLLSAVGGIVRTLAALLNGDLAGAWNGIKGVVEGATRGMRMAVASMVSAVLGYLADLARYVPVFGNNIASGLDAAAGRVEDAAARMRGAVAAAAPRGILSGIQHLPTGRGTATTTTPPAATYTPRTPSMPRAAGPAAARPATISAEAREAAEHMRRLAAAVAAVDAAVTAAFGTRGPSLIAATDDRAAALAETVVDASNAALTIPPAFAAAGAAIAAAGQAMAATASAGRVVGAIIGEHLSAGLLSTVDGIGAAVGNLVTGFSSMGDALRSVGQIARGVMRDLVAALAKFAIMKGLQMLFAGSTGGIGGFVLGALGGGMAKSQMSAAPMRLDVHVVTTIDPSGNLVTGLREATTRHALLHGRPVTLNIIPG